MQEFGYQLELTLTAYDGCIGSWGCRESHARPPRKQWDSSLAERTIHQGFSARIQNVAGPDGLTLAAASPPHSYRFQPPPTPGGTPTTLGEDLCQLLSRADRDYAGIATRRGLC